MPATAPCRETRAVVSAEPIAPGCFRTQVEYPRPPEAVEPAAFFWTPVSPRPR